MILGKGHEDYQIIGKKKIHFSDKEIVKKFLNFYYIIVVVNLRVGDIFERNISKRYYKRM